MRKLFILFAVLSISLSVFAKTPNKKFNNLPSGVFKKTWNGNIVQYDNNGKKIHTYKMKNGKIAGIK